MATRVWGPNKVKAFRHIGVAKAKQAQAIRNNPNANHGLGSKASGITASGHQASTPFIKLQAKGGNDELVFFSWDKSYSYAEYRPGDLITSKVGYGEGTISVSGHKQSMRFDEDREEYEAYNEYMRPGSPTVSEIRQNTKNAKAVVPSGVASAACYYSSRKYLRGYVTGTSTFSLFFARIATIFRLNKKTDEVDAYLSPFLSASRYYEFTAGGLVVGYEYYGNTLRATDLATDLVPDSVELAIPAWLDFHPEGQPPTKAAFNKAGTRLGILYSTIELNDDYYTSESVNKAGYLEYAIDVFRDPDTTLTTMSATLIREKLLLDRDQGIGTQGIFPVDLGYNAESTSNELVIVSVYVAASVSNAGVIPNPRFGEAGYIWEQYKNMHPEYYFGDPNERGPYQYTKNDYYITEYGCDLVFDSVTQGILHAERISWCPWGLGVPGKMKYGSDAYIIGKILAIDPTCRGATIATSSKSDKDDININMYDGQASPLTPVAMPTIPDFYQIQTMAFGQKYTIYSQGTVTNLASRPSMAYVYDMSVSVDVYNGRKSETNNASLYYWFGATHGGIGATDVGSMSAHPHSSRKTWVCSYVPDDIYYAQDSRDQGYARFEYPQTWKDSMLPTSGHHFGGVYNTSGLVKTLYSIYSDVLDAQVDAENATEEPPLKRMPAITLGDDTDNKPHFLKWSMGDDTWRHSKFAVGATWTIFTQDST